MKFIIMSPDNCLQTQPYILPPSFSPQIYPKVIDFMQVSTGNKTSNTDRRPPLSFSAPVSSPFNSVIFNSPSIPDSPPWPGLFGQTLLTELTLRNLQALHQLPDVHDDNLCGLEFHSSYLFL